MHLLVMGRVLLIKPGVRVMGTRNTRNPRIEQDYFFLHFPSILMIFQSSATPLMNHQIWKIYRTK